MCRPQLAPAAHKTADMASAGVHATTALPGRSSRFKTPAVPRRQVPPVDMVLAMSPAPHNLLRAAADPGPWRLATLDLGRVGYVKFLSEQVGWCVGASGLVAAGCIFGCLNGLAF